MGLYKKLDWWSISKGIETMIDGEYYCRKSGSQYADYYAKQLNEIASLSADMWNDLDKLRSQIYYRHSIVEKKITYSGEEPETQTAIWWFNAAACTITDMDVEEMLEREYIFDESADREKEKRVNALERLTKKDAIWLLSEVMNVITEYLELSAAYETIKACIDELDFHQSAMIGKNGEIKLPDTVYI